MTNPKISVIIPTYNRSAFLAECLDSILSQTLPPFQVILVNDGSNDDTLSVIAPFKSKVELLENRYLRGRPSAINTGLERVRGDYVWIFDDDDIALPDALEGFVAPLENYPEKGFSYSTFYKTDINSDTTGASQLLGVSKIPEARINKEGFLIPLMDANFIGGAALFARTSVYKKVGFFDPVLVRSQDYDINIRVARFFKGTRIEGGPTFHYRQHNGMRGCMHERFPSKEKFRYWLKYDQIIFRKLYKELPLSEYLPPGKILDINIRRALLQRMAIMASKLLLPEVIKDLRLLASVGSTNKFSRKERFIIQSIMTRVPYYKEGTILQNNFFKEINVLANNSTTIKLLHGEMLQFT
jgi:glycosyltransferase involved in cell wall biosynthesis